jgi:hypothetical protein
LLLEVLPPCMIGHWPLLWGVLLSICISVVAGRAVGLVSVAMNVSLVTDVLAWRN